MTKSAHLFLAFLLLGCGGGSTGPAGHDGAQGVQGVAGKDGAPGMPGAKGDPGAPGKDAAQSGSRLIAKYLVGDDGSRIFHHWHDSMLDADCAFATASDGSVRCMPGAETVTDGTPVPGAVGVYPYYSDNGCTQVAAVGLSADATPECPAPLPAFVRILRPAKTACSVASYDVWAFDMPVPVPSGTLYRPSGTLCEAVGGTPTLPMFALHVLPPASMVGMSIQ